MSQKFPKGFLWGASTSAHQVEGGLDDDWTTWETSNSQRLAAEAGHQFARRSPVWSEIKAQATDPSNYRSGQASDHFQRYRDDIGLLKQLNLHAYRFSIPWSRIEPAEGVFDKKAIDHYVDLVKTLKEQKIEPFPTLWHWPLPKWLADNRGWLAPDAIERLKRFTTKVVGALSPHVNYWITLNEPNVYASLSYLTGQWPPQKRSLIDYYRVAQRCDKPMPLPTL